MYRAVSALIFVALLQGSLCKAHGQTSPSAAKNERRATDVLIYEGFLREVVHLRTENRPSELQNDGQKVLSVRGILGFAPPDLQEIGLTDAQLETLKKTARDCDNRSASFDQAARNLTLTKRLETVEKGGPSEATTAQGKVLGDQRQRMVEGCISQLMMALGEASFQTLDSYVHRYAFWYDFFCDTPTRTIGTYDANVNQLCESIRRRYSGR